MTSQPAQAIPRDVLSRQSAPTPARPNPLFTVLRWELRRAFASRATWVIVVLLFGILLLLLLLSLLTNYVYASETLQTPAGIVVQHTVNDSITRNSLFGLAILFPITLAEYALFLPFVTADGVSLDLKRRTHELLMTTSLPSWAYVWGRYLASMFIALGIAGVYLFALLVSALALHLFNAQVFPALDLPGALVIWAVVVLPPTLLLSSLCFALGVLLPRHSNLIKGGAVFGWFVIGLLLQAYTFDQARNVAGFGRGNPPAWWTAYETWQPTNTDAGHLFGEQFLRRVYAILDNATLSNQVVQQRVHALYGQMPDLGSFAGAHLVLVALGLAAVVGASLAFRRFRNDLA